MAYIGKSPSGTGVRIRYYFTQTSGGATSISGTDDDNKTLSFSDGEYVDVYLNGVSLVAGTDYNTTTANTIGGLSALANGDVVEVVVYDIFTVADTVSQSSGGTFNGAIIMSNGLTVDDDGATVLTLDRATSDGTVIDVQKDGSTVGGIGSKVGDLTIGTDDTGLRFYDAGNAVLPYNPSTQASPANTFDLGDSGSSFKDLYLGGGLYVGGTAAVNHLDDYEEGTWTPTIDFGGGSTSVAYAYQEGAYTKIGRHVIAHAYLDLTSKGSSSGQIRFGGLPFNVAEIMSSTSLDGAGFFTYIDSISGVYSIAIAAQDSTEKALVYGQTSSGGNFSTPITNSAISNDFECRFTLIYVAG